MKLIQTAKNSRLDTSSLRAYLQSLKDQYMEEIEEIEQMAGEEEREETQGAEREETQGAEGGERDEYRTGVEIHEIGNDGEEDV